MDASNSQNQEGNAITLTSEQKKNNIRSGIQ